MAEAKVEHNGYPEELSDEIEAVERPDKKFCVGVQFHPEVAVRKILDKEIDAEKFMEYDKAVILFKALLERK